MNVFTEILTRLIPSIKESEENLLACPNCSVIRECALVHYRLLQPIENLPESEKKELKQYVVKNYSGLSITELVERCKIIYSITSLM